MYCAEKLGDIIKSTDSYNKGDMSQALKDAFMKCDEIVMKAETIQEMKKMISTETSAKRYLHVHVHKNVKSVLSTFMKQR